MSQQWTPPPAGGAPGSVPNYLVPAILSFFCCWPLSIAAIIFAAQVNGKVASGDMAGALDASKKAKMFSFLAIGLGRGRNHHLHHLHRVCRRYERNRQHVNYGSDGRSSRSFRGRERPRSRLWSEISIREK